MGTNLRKRTDPKDSDVVNIGGERFSIDRKLFSSRSAVWRRAFEHADAHQLGSDSTLSSADFDFNGAQNCEPSTFSLYKQYVESGKFDEFDTIDKEFPGALLSDLIHLHALAWQFEDYTAANFFMDMIIPEMAGDEHEPDPHHIAWVYLSVKPAVDGDCPLRRLLVDFQIHQPRLIHELPFTSCDSERHAYLIEFLQDVIEEYRSLTLTTEDTGPSRPRGQSNTVMFSKLRPEIRGPCYYHKHDDDHLKCQTRETSLSEEDEEAEDDDEDAELEDEEVGMDSEEVKQESEETGQEGGESSSWTQSSHVKDCMVRSLSHMCFT